MNGFTNRCILCNRLTSWGIQDPVRGSWLAWHRDHNTAIMNTGITVWEGYCISCHHCKRFSLSITAWHLYHTMEAQVYSVHTISSLMMCPSIKFTSIILTKNQCKYLEKDFKKIIRKTNLIHGKKEYINIWQEKKYKGVGSMTMCKKNFHMQTIT